LLAPFELVELSFGDRIDDSARDSQSIDDVAIDLADTAGGYRTHGELFVSRYAQLADDEDVERNSKRPSDFPRDRHSAARQAQDDHVVPIAVLGQFRGQQFASLDPITK
jgi:hypothetical protein